MGVALRAGWQELSRKEELAARPIKFENVDPSWRFAREPDLGRGTGAGLAVGRRVGDTPEDNTGCLGLVWMRFSPKTPEKTAIWDQTQANKGQSRREKPRKTAEAVFPVG